MFAFNLMMYLLSGKGSWFKKAWRVFNGSLYVIAVSTVGWKRFKSMKGIK